MLYTVQMDTNLENKIEKRRDYLEWLEYFMAVALLSAQRSKDPITQVGACIISRDNKIVGIYFYFRMYHFSYLSFS